MRVVARSSPPCCAPIHRQPAVIPALTPTSATRRGACQTSQCGPCSKQRRVPWRWKMHDGGADGLAWLGLNLSWHWRRSCRSRLRRAWQAQLGQTRWRGATTCCPRRQHPLQAAARTAAPVTVRVHLVQRQWWFACHAATSLGVTTEQTCAGHVTRWSGCGATGEGAGRNAIVRGERVECGVYSVKCKVWSECERGVSVRKRTESPWNDAAFSYPTPSAHKKAGGKVAQSGNQARYS